MRNSILAISIWIGTAAFSQQPGTLDTTFAEGGKLVLENETGGVVEIASLQDGKMLLMVYNGDTTRILRRFENGDADNGFAGAGVLIRPWRAERMLIDTDERIYLIGNTLVGDEMQGIVQRFLPTGDLDTSYGLAGSVSITFTDTIDFTILFKDADIYPDGRLVICGDRSPNPMQASSYRALMFRLTNTGLLDNYFMYGGIFIFYGEDIDVAPLMCSYGHRVSCPLILLGPLEEIYLVYQRRGFNYCSPGPHIHSNTIYRFMPGSMEFETHGVNESQISFQMPNRLREIIVNIYGKISYILEHQEAIPPLTRCLDSNMAPCTPFYIPSHRYRGISDAQGHFLHIGRNTSPLWILISRTLIHDFVLDPSWGPGGSITYQDASIGVRAGLTIQADGKLLIGGLEGSSVGNPSIVLRYHNIPDPRAQLRLKVKLAGPFSPMSGQMKDHLRSSDLIPLQDPYTTSGELSVLSTYTHFVDLSVLETTGDSAVIDWIWLEALSLNDTSVIVAARAALLLSNGAVTALDGRSPVDMNCGAGQYHLRVRHRNHLSVTTADPITLGVDPIEVDLTSPGTPTFGTDAQMMIDSVMVMWPGNANGDGMVKYAGSDNDRDHVLVAVGGTEPTAIANGYFNADINMDGTVKYAGLGNDRDVILQTIGGTIPTAIRTEQSP